MSGVVEIWPKDTGILDVPVDWPGLASPETARIAREWPLKRSEWKKLPNHPRRNGTQFVYCPPEHTASEM